MKLKIILVLCLFSGSTLLGAADSQVAHYLEEGKRLYAQKNYEASIEILKKASEQDPSNPIIRNYIKLSEENLKVARKTSYDVAQKLVKAKSSIVKLVKYLSGWIKV